MRRILFVLLAVVIGPLVMHAQVTIDNFDNGQPDTSHWMSMEGGSSLILTFDDGDKMEGTGALNVKSSMASLHGWGTYTQFGYSIPDGEPLWDISISDSVSIWIKVKEAPKHPEWMVLRLQFGDRPTPSDPEEQWIYENATILDNVTSGWVQLRVPLFERTTTGTEAPDSTGFITPPSNWSGLTWNNKRFDRNAISEWSIAIVVSGWDPNANLPADSLEVMFDGYERFGARAVPLIIFAGKDWPSYYGTWSWGQSSLSIEEGAGMETGENAIKWIQGDEWGSGWTGWGGTFSSPVNMAGGWIKDSLKFWMKTDTGVGAMRAQFESGGDGKNGTVFQPIADGAWHEYALPLREMVPQDATTNFDSSRINVFGLMAEASAKVGKVVYITKLWTGSPEIDVIPPQPPANLSAFGTSYVNLVTWDGVPNELGVRYNTFFADHPWTDIEDVTVEDLPLYNIPATMQEHLLRSPVTDQNLTYYYGVVSKDAAGNLSTPAVMSSPVTTLAKGVPTISLTPPATFAADGDLAEWSGIAPFWLSVVSQTAHGVPNYLVTDDNDLSLNAYLAVDATYLYVAFDVTDNKVSVDTTAGNDYEQDCPDLFIGLYDWRGKRHDGYKGGATPDYHIRFSLNRIRLDNIDAGSAILMYPGADYIWTEKILTSGYTVEARIPWTALAAAFPTRNDVVFAPKEGMRIPMDFAINDRDEAVTRHAIMCYSPISYDNSYQAMYRWTHTWIGNAWTQDVRQIGDVPVVYALEQNYPNPFNPSTQIRYSLQNPGNVSLKVYDVVGREVATLVDGHQEAGTYAVSFDAARGGKSLASGVYLYRLEAGSFVATHKMMLLK